jgi:AraC family transcriptional activator of pyochelin receptor
MKIKEQEMDCIEAAHGMLMKDPMRHITIQELAAAVALNRNKLQYGFRKKYGLSIYEYRLQMRMQLAASLLKNTDKSIKEIARLTGYKTISSFSVAFKRVFKMAPTHWR